MPTRSPRFVALERPRLSLGPAQDIAPLTLVLGHAGMGKTALVEQWAREGQVDLHWAGGDRLVDENVPRPLLEDLRDLLMSLGGRPSSGSLYVQVLQLVAALSEQTIIVIDDYHVFTDSQTDEELLSLLEASELLHLIVVARRTTKLGSALTLSRTQVRTIDASDLEFTEDEAVAYAELRGVADPEALRRVHYLTHGWPIAVRIATERLLEGGNRAVLTSSANEWLTQQRTLIRSPKGWQLTMLVSICNATDARALAEMEGLQPEEVQKTLNELVDLGLVFIERDMNPSGGPLYSVPPGIRALVRFDAVTEMGERGKKLATEHAMRLAQTHPLEAVTGLLEMGEYPVAAQLAARHPSITNMDDASLLGNLRQVPPATLAAEPVLGALRLLLEMFEGEIDEDTVALTQTFTSAATYAAAKGDAAEKPFLLMALMSSERVQGNAETSLAAASQLEAALAAQGAPDTPREVAFFRSALAFTYGLTGEFAVAERASQRALDIANSSLDVPSQVLALGVAALLRAIVGDVAKAEQMLATLDRLGEQRGLASWGAANAARLLVANERQDFDAIPALLERRPVPEDLNEFWPLYAAAELAVTRGKEGEQAALERAQEIRERARTYVVPSLPFTRELLSAQVARLAMNAGDHSQAQQILARLSMTTAAATPAHAQMALLTGKAQKARHDLEALARRRKDPYGQVDVGFLLSAALWRLDEREAAITAFTAAAESLKKFALSSPLRNIPYETLHEVAEATAEAGGPNIVPLLDAMPLELRCERLEPLTESELHTLETVARHATLQESADAMFVTIHTVKFHLRNIYRKLHVTGRAEAVERARSMRLLRTP